MTSYGVWATCESPDVIREEWYEWIKDEMESNPDIWQEMVTDEELDRILNRAVYKDGKYNFLATDIQGTVYYDIFQMTPASDCGDYTVIYFSTEVAEWA